MNNSNPSPVAMEREQLSLPIVFYEVLSFTDIMFTSLEGATALDKRKYDFSKKKKNPSSLCLLKVASVFCVASCFKYLGKVLILKGNLVADAIDANLETGTKRILRLGKKLCNFCFF